MAERVNGVIQGMKRITDVSGSEPIESGWMGRSYTGDFAVLGHTLTLLEQELETLADAWQVLLLTR